MGVVFVHHKRLKKHRFTMKESKVAHLSITHLPELLGLLWVPGVQQQQKPLSSSILPSKWGGGWWIPDRQITKLCSLFDIEQ